MLIEIIGIPGAGKTMLINALTNETSLKPKLKTWKECKNESILLFLADKKIVARNLPQRFRSIIQYFPVLNVLISNYVFCKYIKHSPKVYADYWGKLAKLLVEGVIQRKDIENDLVPYYINWELEKIVVAQIARHYIERKKTHVILDEGILSAMNSLEKPTKPFNPLLPDSVVFVSTTPQQALAGILERKKLGRINKSQQNKKDSDILNFITEKHQKYVDCINQLRVLNVPVIDYDYKKDSLKSLIKQLNHLFENN